MKKFLWCFLFLFVAFSFGGHNSQAQFDFENWYQWDIPEYKVDLSLDIQGTLYVTETIKADFSKSSRRGIIRDIPYKYGDFWESRKTPVEIISVEDESGKEWRFDKSKSNGYVVLKIGDPDIYLNQEVVYVIKYQVKNVLNALDDNAQILNSWGSDMESVELYWNTISTFWDESPIERYEVSFDLSNFSANDILAKSCYIGSEGTNQRCEFVEIDSKLIVSGDELGYKSGVTIALAFNPSVFDINFEAKAFWAGIKFIGLIVYPFLAFLLFFIVWYKKGRDPEKRVIVPNFKLDKELSPMEMGTLIDERLDMKDITAGIVDLSLRGYLQVVDETKDGLFSTSKVRFVKLKEFKDDKTLLKFELDILNGLFKGGKTQVTTKDLTGSFFTNVNSAKRNVYSHLTKEGYYHGNPDSVRLNYLGLAFFLVFVMVWGAMFFQSFLVAYIFLPLVLFAVGFSFIMPKKTEVGMRMYEKILGFKDFIKIAERERLDFFQGLHNAKNNSENVKFFESLLPYAISLGLGDKWVKICGDLLQDNYSPTWYRSNRQGFAINELGRSLNSISRTVSASAVAPSSSGSSGGGRVGGGFGGGGGRSW